MQKLTKVMDGCKNKHCPTCNHSLNCSSYHLVSNKFIGRNFYCQHCRSIFKFMQKNDLSFHISYAHYYIENFTAQAYYNQINNSLPQDYFLIRRRNGTLDERAPITIMAELQFPILKSQLQDKINLYIAFS